MVILSKTERAYLNGEREFAKAQIRCIKSRLNKKLRLAGEELQNYLNRDNCSGVAEICNGQLMSKLRNTNKSGAGSGKLVPPLAPQRRREGNISNPRVLSDMGLAIPRPTRLGDPRSVCASLSNIILTSLSFLLVLLLLALQP